MKESAILTERVPQCPLCGYKERGILYAGLQDRLFGAPGEWTLKNCRRCGLVFLDPRPRVEDIGKAYATYYTHAPAVTKDSLPRRARRYVRGGYLANKFGYMDGISFLQRLAGWLAYLHPGQREMMNSSVMYLPARYRGRLLEVGFGSGATLSELYGLGWEVEGVDPDAQAVEAVRRNLGLNVRAGTLEAQEYPPDHFDALVVSHVVEHAHNPVDLLRECSRVLKPGGVLVAITPNIQSIIHRCFKRNWLSLDPPRHLTLFSPRTISQLVRESGLRIKRIETTVRLADHIFTASREVSVNGSFSWRAKHSKRGKFFGYAYQYLMAALLWYAPHAGEDLLLVAVKDG